MKKITSLLLALVMLLALCACGGSTSTNHTDSYTATQEGLTDSQIKSATADALVKLIQSKYEVADAGSSRMSINKTEQVGDDYKVYGTVTLYDKYGKVTTGHADGSGSYTRSFEIKINGKTGTAYAGGTLR